MVTAPPRWLTRASFPKKIGFLERLYGHQLSEAGIGWKELVGGLMWKLDLQNPTHRWLVYGEYELVGFHKWLASQLPDTPTIIDSGANLGQFLALLIPLLDRPRIHAFEPNDVARAWLLECIGRNQLSNITVSAKGLGEFRGNATAKDYGPEHSHGSWTQTCRDTEGSIQLTSLDEYATEHQIPHIDFWKLDVEGFEVECLKGARDLLTHKRIARLKVEFGSDTISEGSELLRSAGYRCFDFVHGRLRPSRQLAPYEDVVFLAK